MNNKLTLRMDQSLIASAKNYAAAHGSSVSQMVANYFATLATRRPDSARTVEPVTDTNDADAEQKLGPVTRSLMGLLKPKEGQKPLDEEDYRAYLERKYLGSDRQGQSS